jgi:hypothetical protein
MTHLFVQTLAEIHERYEKVDFIQKQLSELQQELDTYKEALIPYQKEEAQIIAAKDACESALKQLKTALALVAQIRNGVYLPDFKKEIDALLNVADEQETPMFNRMFNRIELNECFLSIKDRLSSSGVYVGEIIVNTNQAKVWALKSDSPTFRSRFAGSRINGLLLSTDCEMGWKLVWYNPEQPRLMWCPTALREPVFINLFEYDRFDLIKKTLSLNEITIEQLLSDKDRSKSWILQWKGEPAKLQWQNWFSGESWTVDSLDTVDPFARDQKKLTGIWEAFDLYECLEDTGVKLDNVWYNVFKSIN